MRTANISNRSRELTDTGGFLLFLFDARLRIGPFLRPPVGEGEEVASSGESLKSCSLNSFTGTIPYHTHRWLNDNRSSLLVLT